MDDKQKAVKFDPNTEAFQMRAQWKKADMCMKQWDERWSWLLDEMKKTRDEAKVIRNETPTVSHVVKKDTTAKSLKPVPVTSTGFVGWIASKPDCALEIYTPWTTKIPLRAPDAWDLPGYMGPPANS